MSNYRKEYEKWRSDPVFDAKTRAEVAAMQDEKEIEDAFYRELSFGTGGLRGVIGAGSNRMNVYTVGKATQGLANFIRSQTAEGSVVIAYDSRKMSPEFALDTALVLCANGIRAYLFESLRPTPELSFAVRFLRATAGIVITASHNPPQYNGYKVYWSDGGQIVPPYDRLIIEEVARAGGYENIRRISRGEAEAAGLLRIVGKEIDDAYVAAVKSHILEPDAVRAAAKDLKIVYTPLHGAGNVPVRRVLAELGFSNVWTVPEQEAPDGAFPTLKSPNPEDAAAFDYALALAGKAGADLVLATDPDADRLGVYARDGLTGEYVPFTGNMSGLLIAEYQLSRRQAKGLMPVRPADGALVTTIVSSDMAFAVGKAYGVSVIEVLTGFKYIGEQIRLFEEARARNGGKTDAEKGAFEYLFGFEESYGCLVGTHARDKDAVMAVTALCEAAAYYRTQGMTLCDVMREMYRKYGYYAEVLATLTLPGAGGAARIAAMMQAYRNDPPAEIGGSRVLALRDYACGVRRTADGKEEKLALPKSNVLYFETEDGWCCVRPSGTEPKIKYYCGAKGDSACDAQEKAARMKAELLQNGTKD